MTTENNPPKCQICLHTRDDHDFKHPFRVEGDETDLSWLKKSKQVERKPGDGPTQPSMPFDPVLRQALIDKGILSVADLRDAEEKIRAITSSMMGGGDDGPRPHGVRRSAGTDSTQAS